MHLDAFQNDFGGQNLSPGGSQKSAQNGIKIAFFKDLGHSCRQNGPREPKWSQNGAKMEPKWSQNGIKTVPTWRQQGTRETAEKQLGETAHRVRMLAHQGLHSSLQRTGAAF